MPKALLLLADGFVDAHAVDLAGALQRQGFDVVRVGLKGGSEATSKTGRTVPVEKGYLDVNLNLYDLVVLPDGACADVFTDHKSFTNIVYTMLHKGRVVVALGRSVRALVPAQNQKTSPNPAPNGTRILQGDIVKGRRVAADAAVAQELQKAGAIPVDDPVVVDGPVVTAHGAAPLGDVLAAAVPTAWRFRALTH